MNGTYTQRRRRQMAGGGITNIRQIGKPGGLVEPGISKYAWYDFIVDPVKDFVTEKALPFVIDKAPEFIGDFLGGKPKPETRGPMGDDMWAGQELYTPPYVPEMSKTGPFKFPTGVDNTVAKVLKDMTGYPSDEGTADEQFGLGQFEPKDKGGFSWDRALATILPGGDEGYVPGGLYNQIFGALTDKGEDGTGTSLGRSIANVAVPLGIGKFAHDYQKDYLAKQPKFPMDETGIKFQTGAEAMADPTQRFKLKEEYADLAEGGRIGYEGVNSVINYNEDPEYRGWKKMYEMNPDVASMHDNHNTYLNFYNAQGQAQGGRIGYQGGGIGSLKAGAPDIKYEGDMRMASDPDYMDSLNDFSMQEFNKPLHQLTPEEYQMLLDLAREKAAQGGRIGYAGGGIWGMDTARREWDLLGPEGKAPYEDFVDFFLNGPWGSNVERRPKIAQGGRIGYADGTRKEIPEELKAILEGLRKMKLEDMAKKYKKYDLRRKTRSAEIPTMAAEGGLMDLGGMEKDYRQEGGFVPIGGEEKADDVPARLSKNEFVFTADAVRNAGGGDIDAGAEVMENLMEHLEAGGKVSEDSQGLEGAQAMFANAQELQKRII